MTSSPLRRIAHRLVWGAGLQGLVFRLREARMALFAGPDPVSPDGRALPPAPLRVLVAGTGDPDYFLRSGRETVAEFDAVLARHGGGFATARRVLDVGCGCGRLARWLPLAEDAVLTGTDINPKGVEWCRRHLTGAWLVTPLKGPMPFEDAAFDLAYACSVVTHLRPDTAQAWLAEAARVLEPGGRLLLTYHDPLHPTAMGVGAALAEHGYAVRFDALEGANHLAAFVTTERLAAMAAPALQLVEAIPSPDTACGQAIAVFRKA